MRLSTEIASSSYHTPHVSQILLAPPRLMAMVFAQCATAALLVEYAAGLALKRSAPKSWHTDINGSSTLSWIVGLIHQALIFPLIGFFALRPFLGSAASFQGESTFLCVAFHAALFAFWAKDCLLTTLNQLTWLHHAICLLAVVASAMGWLVRCVSVFTLGALILELGSGVNAACELRPGLALRLWCTPVMTLSNVCASCLVVWYAITFSSFGGGIGRWAAAIVGTALAGIRQIEWHGRLRADYLLVRDVPTRRVLLKHKEQTHRSAGLREQREPCFTPAVQRTPSTRLTRAAARPASKGLNP